MSPTDTDSERDKQVSTYVTEETKAQLKNEARREGMSLSEYLRDLIEQARLEDTQEQLARDLNAEERLLELIAEGKEEMAEMAEQVEQRNRQVEHLLAKTGSYSIVNFQLLKAAHEPTEAHVSEWFDSASARLNSNDDRDHDLDIDGATSSSGTETTRPVGTGTDPDTAPDTDDSQDRDQDRDQDAASFVEELQ